MIKLEWDTIFNSTRYLLANCVNITEINLNNFDISLVTDMAHMFYYCTSLISVDILNVTTKNLKNIYMMFYHCLSLISIDLSSFDTSSVTDMSELFYGCQKLEYINIKNFTQTEGLKTNGIFSRISNKATICLNPQKVPDIYDLAIQNNIKLDNTETCLLKCNKENPFEKFKSKYAQIFVELMIWQIIYVY